jgi:iron(III) transport system substrate-binding protein
VLAFFRDLVAKNGISPRQGHTLLNNMVVSGEVPLALTLYNYMPEQAKKKGRPIDWFAIEPAVARSNAIGVTRARRIRPRPPLLRLPLGPEGQAAMVSIDYVPTNTKVASPLEGREDRADRSHPLARRGAEVEQALRRDGAQEGGKP